MLLIPRMNGSGSSSIVARFVCAPDVRDLAKLFGPPCDFFFVESLLGKMRFHARDETIDVKHLRRETRHRSRSGFAVRNQTRAGIIQ